MQLFGVFLFAQPAKAVFGAGDISFDPQAWIQREKHYAGDKVEATVTESVLSAVMGSLLHATSYFTRKLAYDAALYVAYGGKGQGSLAYKEGAAAYFEKVSKDTAADAIGELGKPFGLNLCQIPDLRLNIFLQVGLSNRFAVEPTPNCRWQDLKEGGIFDGAAWVQRYGTEEGLAETFSATLSVDNTDFGIALGAIGQISDLQAGAEAAARQDRTEGQGFKPLTSLISGDIKTPAQIVREETNALTAKHQGELSAGQIAGIYGSGLKQVPAMAASVFLNSLTATLLNRLLTEGLFPEGSDAPGFQSGVFSYTSSPFTQNSRARNAFSFLLTIRPEQLTNFNIVAEFAACPEHPGLNNCVIDSDLQQALVQAKSGTPMTIQEAIDIGYLNKDWPLISPRNNQHTIENCQVGRYCYSNIQKMRKVRILPLGFEIAALRSDPDNPWTLGQVVQGFEKCRRDDPNNPDAITPDPAFPFCHLINPNWTIAVPSTRCELNTYGPQLHAEDSPSRRRECMDISTCLAKGPNGECIDHGYCTKEKNVWDLNADTCPAYYNSCDTYTNTEDRFIASYLTRSLDFGQCTADTVGCRAFSLEQIAEDNWESSAADRRLAYVAQGRNERIHFTDAITAISSVCSAASDGCRAFIPAARYINGLFVQNEQGAYQQQEDTSTLLHLKRAPDYLGCYDTNRAANSPEINWPTTVQEAQNVVAQDARCDAYASVCVEEEVGCSAYQPTEGGVEIPGVIGAQNVCDASCVGYDTFKQLGYADVGQGFEDPVFPLYFIPRIAEEQMAAQGTICSAEFVGCDEFTNLDTVANGGEGLEYYTSLTHCEQPSADGANSRVYYSWEGSVREGFLLQTHRVKPIDERDLSYIQDTLEIDVDFNYSLGSPMYANDSRDALASASARCNEQTYNLKINNPGDLNSAPDNCHALYDTDGNVFYRLVGELVVVSDACHALRKTEPEIYADTTLEQRSCSADRGEWNAAENSCTRCVGGGEYRNGACIYWTISDTTTQSQSCPAQANECRAYAGNNAGNRVNILSQLFEPSSEDANALVQAQDGWEGLVGSVVRVVSDASDVGLHSLLLEQGRARMPLSPTSTPGLVSNQRYEITFWARGDAGTIRLDVVQNNNRLATFAEQVSIGNSWNRYRVGPIDIGTIASDQPLYLVITPNDGNNRVFLDTFVFTRIQDVVYLTKDSWKTPEGYNAPLLCDAVPQDTLPGEALGCRSYQEVNAKGVSRYATGFERLCREKAVGCMPVWDTYNTVSGESPELPHVYNVWCAGNEGANCEIRVNNILLGACVVERGSVNNDGQSGCYIRDNDSLDIALPQGITIANLPAGSVSDSTVYIPADTPSSTPLFLANTEKHRCQESQLGCELTGAEQQLLPDPTVAVSYEHQETRIKNDPASYNEVLCNDTLIGCGEFDHAGARSFFRDPRFTGNALCSYREQSDDGQNYGWYINDQSVGRCSQSDTLCREDGDCSGANDLCVSKGNVACYDDFVQRGGEFGLRSNGSPEYAGFVGTCPAQFNECTQLVDPEDTSNINPKGQPYYVVFNDKITNRLGQCNTVSLEEGCVLFDKTDDPNKLYNASATYALSTTQDPPYGPVAPVTTASNNDPSSINTNLLLKVDRDRACSEWLDCKNYVPVTNAQGQQEFLCSQYKACEKLSPDGRCIGWVDDLATPEDRTRATDRLTYEQYIQRGTSWYAEEFSGYSLYDKYQITNLAQLAFNFEELNDDVAAALVPVTNETFIARVLDDRLFRYNNAEDLDCIDETVTSTDWLSCGFDNQGLCYRKKCVYPIDGGFGLDEVDTTNVADIQRSLNLLEANSCKGFPEEESPFSQRIIPPGGILDRVSQYGLRKEFVKYNQGYANINVCQSGECSCEYQKVSYNHGVVDYISFNDAAQSTIVGICSGGDATTAGLPCTRDSECIGRGAANQGDVAQTGTCNLVRETQSVFGLRGFCLERDLSRPSPVDPSGYECLTWLPVQTSVGRADIFNSSLSAGYNPTLDAESGFGKLYCSNGSTYERVNAQDNERIVDALRDIAGNVANSETIFPPHNITTCQVDADGQFGGAEPPTAFHSWNCGADDDNGMPVSFLTSWARKYLDVSAQVLRIETPITTPEDGKFYNVHGNIPNYNPLNGGNAGGGCGSGDDNGSPACTIHSFGPVSINNVLDYGTIMHPPRYWDTPRDSLLQCSGQMCIDTTAACDDKNNPDCWIRCGNEVLQPGYNGPLEEVGPRTIPECGYSYKSFYYTTGSGVTVASHPLSPEFAMYQSNRPANDPELDDYVTDARGNSILNRQDIESVITEKELNRVYFLITGFPHNADGRFPTIMSDRVYLDFLKLQEQGHDIRPKSVPVADGREQYFPLLNNDFVDGSVYSYLLTTENGGTFTYDDYDDLNQLNGHLVSLKDLERNRIHHRYVMIYHKDANEELEGNLGDAGRIPDVFNERNTVCAERSSNWFAIGMDFNEDGEFLGYITRFCNGFAARVDDGNGIQFAVVATKNVQCLEIQEVHRSSGVNPLQDSTNKAWTNRLWVGALQTHPSNNYRGIGAGVPLKEQQATPFGSLAIPSAALVEGQLFPLKNYYFVDPATDGIPYSCGNGNSDVDCYLLRNGNEKRFSTYQYPQNVVSILDGKGAADGIAAINQLFAKSFTISRLLEGRLRTVAVGTDISYQEGIDGGRLLPQVYSLNPVTCALGRDHCTPAEANAFSLGRRNGVANADYDNNGIPDEDSDGDGQADALIETSGSYVAQLRFFAFADDNRMPLRRIMIDWGDGEDITNESIKGLYKNRKPVCEVSNDPGKSTVGLCLTANNRPTGMTCSDTQACIVGQRCALPDELDRLVAAGTLSAEYGSKRFGNLERSCEQGNFDYYHEYVCQQSDIEAHVASVSAGGIGLPYVRQVGGLEDQERLNALGFTNQDYVCVFQPKLQVMDNWGWCTGSCVRDYDRNGNEIGAPQVGCYENFRDPEAAIIFQCSSDNVGGRDNPWILYKNEIIVAPALEPERD